MKHNRTTGYAAEMGKDPSSFFLFFSCEVINIHLIWLLIKKEKNYNTKFEWLRIHTFVRRGKFYIFVGTKYMYKDKEYLTGLILRGQLDMKFGKIKKNNKNKYLKKYRISGKSIRIVCVDFYILIPDEDSSQA